MDIEDAKKRLVDAGATLVRTYSSYCQDWGVKVTVESAAYIAVAGTSDGGRAGGGVATFRTEAIDRARDCESWLLYCSDDGFRVFQPDHVERHGWETTTLDGEEPVDVVRCKWESSVGMVEFHKKNERPETVVSHRDSALSDY